MKHRAHNLLLTTILGIVAAAGCASSPAGTSTGKGGSSGGTGTGGSGTVSGVTLTPDATGWIDGMAAGNTVGVQGAWYAYGDAYGEAKCLSAGHTMAECSNITAPNP